MVRLTPEQAIAVALDDSAAAPVGGVGGYPEVGADDFRLSDMGPDGSTVYGAYKPAVAYNSTDNEYLVVWYGDDTTNGEHEIYGQRVHAATGYEIGADFRLSDMGPDGNAAYGAYNPAVAYNSTDNEYLVVWAGYDGNPPMMGNHEIYGQRVEADGDEIGMNDSRLSSMGSEINTDVYRAYQPAVAYNSTDNEYLVVWSGEDDTGDLVNEEYEIFGQRVDGATGAQVGTDDFRLSDMGPDGNTKYSAVLPDVAYNSTNNEYLVVWEGNDGAPFQVSNHEIYGQRVHAATGYEIGTDFRLSDMGPVIGTAYAARTPAVAYNNTDNEYLVVWAGDDNTGALVDNEFEVYGQRVDAATGAEVGLNDFRLSDMGPDGNAAYDAYEPDVTYSSFDNEYLVVWAGYDGVPPMMGNHEIYGQRVDGVTGAEISLDFRLSSMGSEINTDVYRAYDPAVTYDSTDNEYLAVWWGDDDTGDLVNEEYEIFGQRLDTATHFSSSLVLR